MNSVFKSGASLHHSSLVVAIMVIERAVHEHSLRLLETCMLTERR